MKSRHAALAFCLMTSAFACQADAHKCLTPDGRTEFSSTPCKNGSKTVKTQPDEVVSESARRQAEREVERMRELVEKREAAQRPANGDRKAPPAPDAAQGANIPPPPPQAAIPAQ